MEKIKANIMGEIISSNSAEAFNLNKKSSFGEKIDNKVIYSLSESLFLLENKKMEISDFKNKKISKKNFLKKLQRTDKRIQVKYSVYKDLREKGYIVKTALKFGADFRVYPKGSKPGKSHATWLVFAEYESKKLTWHEFSAKNRVAHSTRKKLLIAVLDEEGDITYYEVKWLKP